jgi:hypothetical protein
MVFNGGSHHHHHHHHHQYQHHHQHERHKNEAFPSLKYVLYVIYAIGKFCAPSRIYIHSYNAINIEPDIVDTCKAPWEKLSIKNRSEGHHGLTDLVIRNLSIALTYRYSSVM